MTVRTLPALFFVILTSGCAVRAADPNPQGAARAVQEQPEYGPNGPVFAPVARPKQPGARPAETSAAETIPQILRRREAELIAEQERAKKLEAELGRALQHIDELRSACAAARKESDALKAERDAALTKARERDEMLVAMALSKAEAERDAIEEKIRFERALASAAQRGVLLDPKTGQQVGLNATELQSAASRPAMASAQPHAKEPAQPPHEGPHDSPKDKDHK
ncbi:MAG: hypothetical protein JNJ88_00295 [Planctomycetes bacterium]|nr:hypothetical protein [Planctomycetota bacterium]